MKISRHLQKIMDNHNRTCNMQVVFLDIEKYSQRRTASQIDVIDEFTDDIKKSIKELSQKYFDYLQANEINLTSDSIIIPTGDGAAVVFSFDGIHDIHSEFSIAMMNKIYSRNTANSCEKFVINGWCNCHGNYNLRIGISEGKGILYRDVNGEYNVAGNVINMAARVMGLADRNQIMFTKEAFNQLVDMSDDVNMVNHFIEFNDIEIKHGLKISVHQYANAENTCLNREPPESLVLKERMKRISENFKSLGFPKIDNEGDRNSNLAMLEKFSEAMSTMIGGPNIQGISK